MSHEEVHPEELVARFSHQPYEQTKARIQLPDPPRLLSHDQLTNRSSCLGDLDKLPNEVIHMVMDELDLQTISRIAQVCTRGTAIVDGLPAYRELVKHARVALAALGYTRTLHLHSAGQLRATLWSQRCAYCKEYGAYLFLLECKRACNACLLFKASLRLLYLDHAQRLFGLTEQQIKQLPTLHSRIPRTNTWVGITPRPSKLVGARAARELAISVHGSEDNLPKCVPRRRIGVRMDDRAYYNGMSSDKSASDLLKSPSCWLMPFNRMLNTSMVPFPSIQSSGVVQTGLWCRGCHQTSEWATVHLLSSEDLASLVPTGCSEPRILQGMAHRARSKAGFLEHIKDCFGVRELLSHGGSYDIQSRNSSDFSVITGGSL